MAKKSKSKGKLILFSILFSYLLVFLIFLAIEGKDNMDKIKKETLFTGTGFSIFLILLILLQDKKLWFWFPMFI